LSPTARCNGLTPSCFKIIPASKFASYLEYALRESQRLGLYVHYSETHDNTRLAGAGASGPLLRIASAR